MIIPALSCWHRVSHWNPWDSPQISWLVVLLLSFASKVEEQLDHTVSSDPNPPDGVELGILTGGSGRASGGSSPCTQLMGASSCGSQPLLPSGETGSWWSDCPDMFQMDIMGILQLYFGFAAGIAALQPSRQRHARSWASASSLACLLVVRDLWTSHHHSISWLRCFFPRKPHLCWKSSITLLYQALLSAGGAGSVIDLKSSSSWPQEREQTWRQQCQSKVSAKKSIMVMPLDSSAAHGVCCHLPGDCFGVFHVQTVGQGDPRHLHWCHLEFRAVSAHLHPPPAGIWAGGISSHHPSWRGMSDATTTGGDPSEVLGSLSLKYVVGLRKIVVLMAPALQNLRLVSFWRLFSSGGSRR